MKRVFMLILSLIIALSFVSCGKNEESGDDDTEYMYSDFDYDLDSDSDKTEEETKSDTHTESSQISKGQTSKIEIPSINISPNISPKSDSKSNNCANGVHSFVNNRCSLCGKVDIDNLYNYLKDFVVSKGRLNGDYVAYTKTSDVYGGNSNEDFSLYYWGDTDTVEFCLHSVIDDTYSINFYIRIPKQYNGNYEYITSYYYRSSGNSVCQAKGSINSGSFTKNYPLSCSSYSGSSADQNNFMEISRVGICDTLDCIAQFLKTENTGYTLLDIGFTKF